MQGKNLSYFVVLFVLNHSFLKAIQFSFFCNLLCNIADFVVVVTVIFYCFFQIGDLSLPLFFSNWSISAMAVLTVTIHPTPIPAPKYYFHPEFSSSIFTDRSWVEYTFFFIDSVFLTNHLTSIYRVFVLYQAYSGANMNLTLFPNPLFKKGGKHMYLHLLFQVLHFT